MLKLFSTFILITISQIIFAQSDPFFDDISQALKEKPKVTLRSDSRNSFISNDRAVVWGYKIGLDYQEKIRLGIGYSFLRTSLYMSQKVIINNEPHLKDFKIHLEYISLFADYVFHKKGKWEFNLPIQFGGGYSYLKYKQNNEKYILHKKFTLIYEANINGMYKLIKGLGIGVGTGYRIMLINNHNIDKRFSSPIYVFRIKFFPFDFIDKDIFFGKN